MSLTIGEVEIVEEVVIVFVVILLLCTICFCWSICWKYGGTGHVVATYKPGQVLLSGPTDSFKKVYTASDAQTASKDLPAYSHADADGIQKHGQSENIEKSADAQKVDVPTQVQSQDPSERLQTQDVPGSVPRLSLILDVQKQDQNSKYSPSPEPGQNQGFYPQYGYNPNFNDQCNNFCMPNKGPFADIPCPNMGNCGQNAETQQQGYYPNMPHHDHVQNMINYGSTQISNPTYIPFISGQSQTPDMVNYGHGQDHAANMPQRAQHPLVPNAGHITQLPQYTVMDSEPRPGSAIIDDSYLRNRIPTSTLQRMDSTTV